MRALKHVVRGVVPVLAVLVVSDCGETNSPGAPADAAIDAAFDSDLDAALVDASEGDAATPSPYHFIQMPAAAGGTFEDRFASSYRERRRAAARHRRLRAVDATVPNVPSGITTNASTGVYASGSSLSFSIALDDGTAAAWSFTVGATPVGGRDLVRAQFDAAVGSRAQSNLGIMPFFRLDVLYDLNVGKIGFATKA